MKAPRIEVICVGTELLTGRINTHASYLGVKLGEVGLGIQREHTVPDDEPLMLETFREAFRRADVVLSCGGLGPTFDDVTREIWSRVTNRSLASHPRLARDIQAKFAARKIPMPPANLRQAMVMRGAVILKNPHGTAPGQMVATAKKLLVLLPGPARELYPMFEAEVLPELLRRYRGRHALSKSFLIAGVPESRVDQLIRPLVDSRQRVGGCAVVHGIVASQSLITVKFRVDGGRLAEVKRAHKALSAEFRELLSTMVIAEDEDSLETIVGALLARRKESVAVAESCTGGLIAKMLTDRPGSSRYVESGVITYSNASKVRDLGVSKRFFRPGGPGAVSQEVALAMAEGIRRRTRATHGLAVTGIAGPGGAEPGKPVGTVHIACASAGRSIAKSFSFNGDRAWIRQRSAVMALDLLRQEIVRPS